jgi:hypothetical protein
MLRACAVLNWAKEVSTEAVSSVDRVKSGMPREAGEASLLSDEFGSSLNERAIPVSCDMPQGDADVMLRK